LSHSLLLCIDQHAGHERVRLERFEASLSRRVEAAEAKGVDARASLSHSEASVLRRFRSDLERWRFRFRLEAAPPPPAATGLRSNPDPDGPATRSARLTLEAAPVIAGYRLNAGDMMEFAAALDGSARREGGPGDGPRPFRRRPPAVSRVLASKACRGSIMFGDPLDGAACAALVRQLAATEMPFQCAHGRPSLFPIAKIADIGAARRGPRRPSLAGEQGERRLRRRRRRAGRRRIGSTLFPPM
jgi:DNA mismatch repair protein MLH3